MNSQAQVLQQTIIQLNPAIHELLSLRGRDIFFPQHGILAQTAEAKSRKINATIGVATEENHQLMTLAAIADKVHIPADDVFNYAPSGGKQKLREAWQSLMREKNPGLGDRTISLPVVTCGITHGLSLCGYLLIDTNDTIILPDLHWENYEFVFANNYGARFDTFPMFQRGAFHIDALRQKLLSAGDKKIVLLNFPNNPTGYTVTEEEAAQIIDAVGQAASQGKKIAVLLDDAYFGLVFCPGVYRQSLFAPLSKLHPNVLAVKIDGATKEEYAWGFRVGFITYGCQGMPKALYAALEEKTVGALRATVSNSPNISQSLILQALASATYRQDKQSKLEILRARYDAVVETLHSHSEYADAFSALPFNSGYFMCVELHKADTEKVRQLLLQKYDTGVLALGNLLRIAFSSLAKNDIAKLFANIYQACQEVQKA